MAEIHIVLRPQIRGEAVITAPPLDLDAIKQRTSELEPSQAKEDIWRLIFEVEKFQKLYVVLHNDQYERDNPGEVHGVYTDKEQAIEAARSSGCDVLEHKVDQFDVGIKVKR